MAVNSPSFSVSGKTAIVTGSGSGINLCFASLLLSRGCNVVFADLSLRPEAQKVVDSYSSKPSGKPRAVFQKTDVREWLQLQRMFEAADREFGGADIVCPGAGVFEPLWSNFWHPPGTALSKDAVDGNRYASLDINVTHPIRTTQLALATFLNPAPGRARASPANPKRIVHISSIAGQLTALTTPLYFASKHAISGFIRSLGALDAAFGIRVSGVAPGVVRTPLWVESAEKMRLLDEASNVWVTPEEVAEAMLALCEDGSMAGGTVLEVGHGHTRRVQALNDPGPSGAGHETGRAEERVQEILRVLREEGWGKVEQ